MAGSAGRVGKPRRSPGQPFKRKAQRRKFAALLMSGDITPEQYERWNQETGGATLPERVKKKRKKKK